MRVARVEGYKRAEEVMGRGCVTAQPQANEAGSGLSGKDLATTFSH